MCRSTTIASCLLLAPLAGCVVIPIGDLLEGPALREQVLVEGDGVFAKEKIALVDVSGIITGEETQGALLYAPNSVAEIKAALEWAEQDPEVKAVVLRISSPGGEVTACDILHREVSRLRDEARIPVVACILDTGASGAYYVACAANHIVAHPTAIVGSIGVILQHFDLSGLLEKIGVVVDPVKSSESKDLNSIWRRQTAAERAVLAKVVADLYDRFVGIVVKGRLQMTRGEVLALADGRVVSGTEAVRLKLVDREGYLIDAIAAAAELASVSSPTVVRYTRRAQAGSNIYSRLGGPERRTSPSVLDLGVAGLHPGLARPGFYYLWRP